MGWLSKPAVLGSAIQHPLTRGSPWPCPSICVSCPGGREGLEKPRGLATASTLKRDTAIPLLLHCPQWVTWLCEDAGNCRLQERGIGDGVWRMCRIFSATTNIYKARGGWIGTFHLWAFARFPFRLEFLLHTQTFSWIIPAQNYFFAEECMGMPD